MYFVDNNTGVPVMPPVKEVLSSTPLFFTEGGNGVPPTWPGPDWFNIIQSELINFLAAYGLNPEKSNLNQLQAAVEEAIRQKATESSALLTAIAALVTSANKMPYFTGKDKVAMTDLTDFARTLLGRSDAAGVLTDLGLEDFANKAATTKQTFADALACKFGVEVNDDQGTTRVGLYTSNGQSKITGYGNKAILIPDKAGTMALAGESVTALRLSAPREVSVTAADAWVNFTTSEMVVGIYITPTPGGGAWVLNKVKVSTLQANINGAWVNVTQ